MVARIHVFTKKFLKAMAYVVLVPLFSVCFLVFIFVGYGIISDVLREKCDLSKEIAEINFVGHVFHIPSQHVRDCYPNDRGSDSASMTLDFLLPDFIPIANRSKDHRAFKPNELRIFFWGTNHDLGETDPNIKFGETPMQFSADNAYSKPNKMDNGLVHYKKAETYPKYLPDVYLHQNEQGNIDFVIRCRTRNSICDCSSDHENLFNNVSFSYCYNKEHLPHAVEIDKRINDFLRSTQKNIAAQK